MQPPISSPRFRSPSAERARRSAGFTLVEVAMAMGIVAVAFVSLLALIPAGHTAFRRAVDIGVCGQIAQRVLGDAQESDFSILIDEANAVTADQENYTFRGPRRNASALRYFDEQAREIVVEEHQTGLTRAQKTRLVYQVNTRIMPRVMLPGVTPGTGTSATLAAPKEPMAQVTVQIAHNPGGIVLPFSAAKASSDDPTRNLWKADTGHAGIDVFTYSTIVGRAR